MVWSRIRGKSFDQLQQSVGARLRALVDPVMESAKFRMGGWMFRPGRGCPSVSSDPQQLRAILRQGNRPRYLFDGQALSGILAHYGDPRHAAERAEVVARADRLVTGIHADYVPLATVPQVPFPSWHLDLTTGAEWPVVWYRNIDYSSDQRIGEIRHLWDLHRQLQLPALAQAWLLTRHRPYLEHLMGLYYDWWSHNPVGYGIAWIGPQIQEHAIRNLQWISCLFMLLHDDEVPTVFIADLLQGIELQSRCLDWYYDPEKIFSHNHLVSESLGLWLAGLLFPELEGASDWVARGEKGLQRSLHEQLSEEGVHNEWTTNYHCMVLECAILARCIAEVNGIQSFHRLDDRLLGAARFAASMTMPDGRIPYVGDADDAIIYAWAANPQETRYRYAATLAVFYGDPDLKRLAGRFHLDALWLTGPQAVAKWEDLAVEEQDEDFAGYHCLNGVVYRKRGGTWLYFHGGPAKVDPRISGHLHGDCNSILCWMNGHEILVDPGTWLYNGSMEQRYQMRSTISHNTACIDYSDQAEFRKLRFHVTELPRIEKCLWAVGNPLLVVGRTRSRAGDHLRALLVKGDRLIVVDELRGRGESAVASFIVAPNGLHDSGLHLLSVHPTGTMQQVETSERAWAGGRSRRYGVMDEARRVETQVGRDGDGVFRMRHMLAPAGMEPPILHRCEDVPVAAWEFADGVLMEPGARVQWRGRTFHNDCGTFAWVDGDHLTIPSRGGLEGKRLWNKGHEEVWLRADGMVDR
jgi:hypothetical protein